MNSVRRFLLHDWRVEPDRHRLVGPEGEVHLTPRTMAVLSCLADHPGEVVSRDSFSERVWAPAVVTDDALTRCISELRRALGDTTAAPRFIETIPKRGYRLVAPVEPIEAGEDLRAKVASGDVEKRASDRTASARLALAGLAAAAISILWAVWAWWGPAPGSPSESETQLSIAVMPFRTIGPQSGVPLAEGMHFDLLSRLSGLPSLRVISSSAVARYRDSDWSVAEVSRELAVEWILDGSVQQDGSRVQVNAQLIDVTSDSHRWARTYRRDLGAGQLFVLQGEVIEDIARSLARELDAGSGTDPNQAPTQNLEAYTLFTQARTLLARRSAVDMSRAVDLFKAAIELDPNYAPALAALADTQMLLAYYDYAAGDDLIPSARANALRALAIDPGLARAHVVLGVIGLIDERDGPAALRSLEKAYGLDSGFTGWLGWAQAVLGNLDSALENASLTLQINPHAPGAEWTLAQLKFCEGDLGSALRLVESARMRSPAYARAHLLEGQVRLAMGQPAEALRSLERARDHLPDELEAEFETWQAVIAQRAGQSVDLVDLEARLQAENAVFELGLLQWSQNQLDAAQESFMQAQWTDLQTLHLRYNPLLANLRAHPNFDELLAAVEQSWKIPAR